MIFCSSACVMACCIFGRSGAQRCGGWRGWREKRLTMTCLGVWRARGASWRFCGGGAQRSQQPAASYGTAAGACRWRFSGDDANNIGRNQACRACGRRSTSCSFAIAAAWHMCSGGVYRAAANLYPAYSPATSMAAFKRGMFPLNMFTCGSGWLFPVFASGWRDQCRLTFMPGGITCQRAACLLISASRGMSLSFLAVRLRARRVPGSGAAYRYAVVMLLPGEYILFSS